MYIYILYRSKTIENTCVLVFQYMHYELYLNKHIDENLTCASEFKDQSVNLMCKTKGHYVVECLSRQFAMAWALVLLLSIEESMLAKNTIS